MSRKRKFVELIADLLDVNYDPVNRIIELEDSPDKAYIWDMDMTDEQITAFTQEVQSTFVKKYNKDPQSLHFIRNDVSSVKELSPEVVRAEVEPWLNNKNRGEE